MKRSLRNAIAQRDRFTCQSCGRRTRGQVHHIQPRCEGGLDLPANLVTLCGRCHMLVSPIPLHVLQRVLKMDEQAILVERARVEVAIHSWALSRTEKGDFLITDADGEQAGLRGSSVRPRAQKARPIPEWKRLRPRAGKAWSSEEDIALVRDFEAGLPLDEIACRQGRGVFAVEVRLCKLGRSVTSKS